MSGIPEVGALYRCHPIFWGNVDVAGIPIGAIVLLVGWSPISNLAHQAIFLFGEKKIAVAYTGYAGFQQEFTKIGGQM